MGTSFPPLFPRVQQEVKCGKAREHKTELKTKEWHREPHTAIQQGSLGSTERTGVLLKTLEPSRKESGNKEPRKVGFRHGPCVPHSLLDLGLDLKLRSMERKSIPGGSTVCI